MQMKTATILTVLWSFCWMIQGIAGNPVPPPESRQSKKYGPPLTAAELNCIPKVSKSETHHNYSEGNDILPMPSDGKNAYLSMKWPNPSRIPYEIDSAFDAKARCAIGAAMTAYQKNTCIRFVPRKGETDYVQINKYVTAAFLCNTAGAGYYAAVGNHSVNFSPSCFDNGAGTAMHELMHRLGFLHEHSRPDRDNYIDIKWDEIDPKFKSQYNIAKDSNLILSYDYGSVLHYSAQSMVPKVNTIGAVIGQRFGLSKLDIMKLNQMYC